MSDLLSSPLTVEQITENFHEIEPALSQAEAVFEAHRCLYCYDAPCIQACPTHIDVPSFIKKIASGNLRGSARVILDANPIGSTCSRVCPVEALCEGACVENTLMKQPIQIGRLQRYAMDHIIGKQIDVFKAGATNGKSVGIIGSGPAGLSCATYLARLGYAVTIYEQREKAGGLGTYGMAEYKMTQQHSADEVAMIERLGVQFRLGCEIGQNISLADLETAHDAIFIGAGLGATNKLNISGEDLVGVYDALEFIEHVKTRDWASVPIANTVAVIGAGNTAIDAVTQAKRLGAEKVLLIYRRTQREMSAYEYEYELAKKDAVEFCWQTAPLEIIADASGTCVAALRCVRTEINSDGKLNNIAGSEFELPVQMVIKATGQQKQRNFFTNIAGVNLDAAGRLAVNQTTMQTGNPKYFAGGDCVNGGAEAVDAAQHGKHAAMGIHKFLSGEEVKFAGA